MSLNSNDLPSGGGNIDPMEPGSYPARTVCMVDLGLQAQPDWMGKPKPPNHMIAITYEFVDEFLKDEDGEDIEDKPRWLTEMITVYPLTAEKAKSTARYTALDPKLEFAGDFSKIIDVPCMVTIVHNPNKKTGGVYENIGGVTPMREKDAKKCPPLVNDSLVFDLDEPDLGVFDALPGFIQNKITDGLEYEGSVLYELLLKDRTPEDTKSESPAGTEPDDEIPY